MELFSTSTENEGTSPGHQVENAEQYSTSSSSQASPFSQFSTSSGLEEVYCGVFST